MTESEEKKKFTEEERCRVAWEIAIDEAMHSCNWEGKGKEEAFKVIGGILGLDEKESNDVSAKCEAVLGQEITKDLCYDFRRSRQYVLCATWRNMEEKRIRFSDAIREAWAELKSKCMKVGAYI